ncbi:MAG: hypothetical protein JKY56_25525 [Kofleriaceae bacterium]|nr:hypothetical protein [Kofleriaceae bacterium]
MNCPGIPGVPTKVIFAKPRLPLLLSMALVIGFVVTGGAVDALANPAVFEKDFVELKTPEGVQIKEVSIDNRLGDVTVQGHDLPYISIQSFKRADDHEALERLVVSLTPDASGHVRVTTSLRAGDELRPLRSGSVAVNLLVLVPRQAAVRAQLWNGVLDVSKVDNGASLRVDSGHIKVENVSGLVTSHIRRGDQLFAQLFGDLEAQGIEGKLNMDGVRGKLLRASLVRGSIVGRNINSRDMEVRNVLGDIDLEAQFVPGGKYLIVSRRGNVSVRFRGQAVVTMTLSAPRVVVDDSLSPKKFGQSRWRAHFGMRQSESGRRVRPAQLEVRSSSGSVAVKHF